MLTHVEIEGFKSFGSPSSRLDFGPLNLLVGPNASGKSNFLAALEFLQTAIISDVETAVNEFGGISEIWNKRIRDYDRSFPIHIRIRDSAPEMLEPYGFPKHRLTSYNYDLSLALRSEHEPPVIQSERIYARINNISGERFIYQMNRSGSSVRVEDALASRGSQTRNFAVYRLASGRSVAGLTFDYIPLIVWSRIREWKFYHIDASIARQAYRENPEADLGCFGENLAVVVNRLKQQGDGRKFTAIEEALRGMVPGFEHVLPVSIGAKLGFQIAESNVRSRFNAGSVSDGTVRLLALLTILLSSRQGDLIAIEEPENGLHPHITPDIIELLRICSNDGGQIFATTHNPAFLDEAKPEEVFLCDKMDGFTQVVRASSLPDIHAFGRSFSLGELWEQGALGGIP